MSGSPYIKNLSQLGLAGSTPMSGKPLGRKSYGSIAHLPLSRIGPGDHKCHEGQSRIATVKTRDRHDVVFVQEKLDGSNVAVAKVAGAILPLSRAGYHANSSPYQQHHEFAKWVAIHFDRFDALLQEGERLCGEWLYQAHGTRYALPHEPFVAFDLMTGETRLPFDALVERLAGRFVMPKLLHRGAAFSIDDALAVLGEYGFHGALDAIEGAVWRIERQGAVDYLVKFVRPDKVDGCYLETVSGCAAVINTWPNA